MDLEKLEKSKKNLLEQLEELKKLKKLKKKTEEESAFSDEFGSNKKKLGRRGKGGGMIPKKEDFFVVIDDKFMKDPDKIMEKIIITAPEKKAKGGRAGLKGGGICKRGMNSQAIGKNS